MSLFRRLFRQPEQPSDWPPEIVDRLTRYDMERQERMAMYAANWKRKGLLNVERPTVQWRVIK